MDDLKLTIGEDLADALRRRAAEDGLSIEDEALQVLSKALTPSAKASSEMNAAEAFRILREEVGGGVDIVLPDRWDWEDRPLNFGT